MPTPKLIYDIGTGQFMTRETAVRVTMDRVAWERKQKMELHSAPPEGYGIDGRPLMRGEVKKMKCNMCGKKFQNRNRPDGLPNGVGFERQDGTRIDICADCLQKLGSITDGLKRKAGER